MESKDAILLCARKFLALASLARLRLQKCISKTQVLVGFSLQWTTNIVNQVKPSIVLAIMTSSNSSLQGMVDPTIFEHLQNKLDEDVQVHEDIKNIVQSMERRDRLTTSILSRAHSMPQSERWSFLWTWRAIRS